MKPIVDQFSDKRILRFRVEGFDSLPLDVKKILYYFYEASLSGRDILWDQNDVFALEVRRVVECVYINMRQKGSVDARLEKYLKEISFANGLHHHYSCDKLKPEFSSSELLAWADNVPDEEFLSYVGRSQQKALQNIEKVLFEDDFHQKKVNLSPEIDVLKTSAVNFYQGVTQAEVEEFYNSGKGKNALNSTISKGAKGEIIENIWTIDGKYGSAIEKIVYWLEQAEKIAPASQQVALKKLINYYKTGKISDFDDYSIAWLNDRTSPTDLINGFIEVYSDPLGKKGTWESISELIDEERSEKAKQISHFAQYFEDHSPVDDRFKKKVVSGVQMTVIQAVTLGGDCYPSTPIGVNLPNDDTIRQRCGSKSISIGNITRAYHEIDQKSGTIDEFAYSQEEKERAERYGAIASELHTQLHECLGHGSGQVLEGVSLDCLKSYASTIEEARADLFALYFIAEEKLRDLGIVENAEVAYALYDSYLRTGLFVQLARIELNRNIEESHMRARHLIAAWIMERAESVEVARLQEENGKHYVQIKDYSKLRTLFGDLLREIQRIKSTGDYEAAKNLVENYGVKIDPDLHREIRSRYEKLGIAPFSGFVNPRLEAVYENGEIVDVKISYDEGYLDQMLRYSAQYSFLKGERR